MPPAAASAQVHICRLNTYSADVSACERSNVVNRTASTANKPDRFVNSVTRGICNLNHKSLRSQVTLELHSTTAANV
jgi:hypothetical protein